MADVDPAITYALTTILNDAECGEYEEAKRGAELLADTLRDMGEHTAATVALGLAGAAHDAALYARVEPTLSAAGVLDEMLGLEDDEEGEAETDQCSACSGTGQVFARWSKGSGASYKQCDACGGEVAGG